MSYPSTSMPGWGPQPPQPAGGSNWRRWAVLAVFCVGLTNQHVFSLILLAGLVMFGVRVWRWGGRPLAGKLTRPTVPAEGDPLSTVLAEASRLGGGAYLGADRQGSWRLARAERAVLLLGPPRSGKTSGVIIPSLLTHSGPVVCTSTKPDVQRATVSARARLGEVWGFDPTGTSAQSRAEQLRWSPTTSARTWDRALLMARAMVTGASVGVETTDRSHWARRAQALLASLLHASALDGGGIDKLVEWVLCHDCDEPGRILAASEAELASGVLLGIAHTEARERSSIFSSAADAIDAYTASGALAAARDPNFDADRFVRSSATIYIDAPAERQHLAAPLVCGLLSEIREATYRAHRQGDLHRRVLFALDEVANIAPLDELPAIASEGGGQGIQLLAALQDLSQARGRWGPAADGFLTLFGTKLILPGIADQRTLETVSTVLGEYDRQMLASTRTRGGHGSWVPQRSQTMSVQRQRVLSPGEIANIPAGRALHLDGVGWELLTLTPAHAVEPWATLTDTSGAGR